MRAVLVLCLFAACERDTSVIPASAGSNADPWAVVARTDDPPSLAERHKLAEEACPTVKAPYFYRVEKDGAVNYLLGTRHVDVPFSKFPSIVHDTLHDAKHVVFELAPGDRRTRKKRNKGAEVSLPEVLGPDLWQHYRELVGSSVADANSHTTPLRAALTLDLMYDDPSSILEHEIEAEAKPLHVPMDGLETSDFQHDILLKLFDARLLRAMVKSTKDRATLRDDKMKGLRAYCEGKKEGDLFSEQDRSAMHDVGYTDDDIAGYENTLVYDRNAAWIPALEEMFAGGGVFVAVGAGHLRGPKGVPALLQAQGYTVTRVTPPE